jgi:hypothetical protein
MLTWSIDLGTMSAFQHCWLCLLLFLLFYVFPFDIFVSLMHVQLRIPLLAFQFPEVRCDLAPCFPFFSCSNFCQFWRLIHCACHSVGRYIINRFFWLETTVRKSCHT